jgi:cytochrome oxidase assembly protein ShyY1
MVYRFLATPRWIGYAVLSVVLAVIMVELGVWQLHRYHARSSINAAVDATARAAPVAMTGVLGPVTGGAGSVGRPPPERVAWTRVTVTGRYDGDHEVLVRGRSLDNQVGFEIITPLLLDGGSAVLVDRGWLPALAGAEVAPAVPAPATGVVTVVGRVHLPESGAGRVTRRDGRLETRRIAPAAIAPAVPYPLYGAYLMMQDQTPPPAAGLREVPPPRENALQNGGYVLQWWLFAVITLVGFGYFAYHEAHRGLDPAGDRMDDPAPFRPPR